MRIAETIRAYQESPDSYDCVNIVVDGSPISNLEFNGLEEKFELPLPLCIEIFLDIHTETFSFFSEFEYAIRKRALEVLLEKIANLPENRISHIILYRGSIDFSNHIKGHKQTSEEFDSWKEELPENQIDEEHLLNLYSSHLLSIFFHSIASILPDHIKGTLLFSLPASLECGKVIELISEESFSHLEIGIKYPKFFLEGICWGMGSAVHTLSYFAASSKYSEDDVKTAVVLPFLGLCNYKEFEQVCTFLISKEIPFKIIEENLMNEKWFGIDTLYYDPDTISFDGKRMLDGFIAAGGVVEQFSKKNSCKISTIIL